MPTFALSRLLRDRGGNVAIMYALVAPMLAFGAGAAVDYGRAEQAKTKLNAAADAAANAALTPAMLKQSAAVAEAAAVSMFKGLANGVSDLTPGGTEVRVTISGGVGGLGRNVEVDYASSVNTIFSQVLGMDRLPVSGTSQASSPTEANTDPQPSPSAWAQGFMTGRAACLKAGSALEGCAHLARRPGQTRIF